MQGPNPLGPTLKLFQSSKIEKAIAKFVTTIDIVNMQISFRRTVDV
jgi:hypothetical protein